MGQESNVNKTVLVQRPILWFAKTQEVQLDKLYEYFTPKALESLFEFGYLIYINDKNNDIDESLGIRGEIIENFCQQENFFKSHKVRKTQRDPETGLYHPTQDEINAWKESPTHGPYPF